MDTPLSLTLNLNLDCHQPSLRQVADRLLIITRPAELVVVSPRLRNTL